MDSDNDILMWFDKAYNSDFQLFVYAYILLNRIAVEIILSNNIIAYIRRTLGLSDGALKREFIIHRGNSRGYDSIN